jgi:hypothetical protein
MSNAYPTQTVMAMSAMNIGFTGRDGVATSCQWLDPQPQQPALFVLKHTHDDRGAGRPVGRERRKTPMRLPTASRRPSPALQPAFSRGG